MKLSLDRSCIALLALQSLLDGCVLSEDPSTSEDEDELGELRPWGDLSDQLGNCLDVTGGGTSNRTPVQTWGCNGYGSQQWQMSTASGPIKNVKSQRVLDAPY